MNKVFNIRRFWNLLKVEFRLDALPMAANTAITLAAYLLVLCTVSDENGKLMWFMWGLMLFVGIVGVFLVAGEVCGNVRGRNKFVSFYMLPASCFEKTLARLTVCHIVPMTVFVALSFLLYCSDGVTTYIHYNADTYPAHIVVMWLIVWLTSLCAFFGAWFRKFGIVAFAVFVAVVATVAGLHLNHVNLMFLDPLMRYVASDPTYGNMYTVFGVFAVVCCIVNYVAAYFAISRKEMNVKLFNW